MRVDKTNYGRGAHFYDALGEFYSLGAIRRSKECHLEGLTTGSRVLYVGAGTGAEALLARQRGAEVTLLDSSPAMLELSRRRFAQARLEARFVEATLEDFARTNPATYDVVTVHFFLNVFEKRELPRVLAQLTGLLEPGGQLWVADFRAPSSNWLFRWLQRAYYLPPLAFFAFWAGNPWHELYDYAELVAGDLELVGRQTLRTCGLPLYEALRLQRRS